MITHHHTYCLKCRKPNAICTQHDDFKFTYHHSLRVPNDHTKRPAFRKFLDICPFFVEGVREEQQEMFKDLLRDVKYFNKTLNGKSWTNIKK